MDTHIDPPGVPAQQGHYTPLTNPSKNNILRFSKYIKTYKLTRTQLHFRILPLARRIDARIFPAPKSHREFCDAINRHGDITQELISALLTHDNFVLVSTAELPEIQLCDKPE